MNMLNVAIGIVFVYLLLGLACTVVNEFLMSIRGVRAKDLEGALTRLLAEETTDGAKPHPDDAAILLNLKKHPLIQSLYTMPSPLLALWARLTRQPHTKPTFPSYIPSNVFSTALIAAVAETVNKEPAPIINSLQSLKDTVGKLPDGSRVKEILSAHIAQAEGEFSEAAKQFAEGRKNVERWFDNMMDRLSGQFVRKAQALSLFVAVTLTLITNADTISVFKHLSLDPAFAKTFADEAQKFANDNPSAPNAPSLKKIEDAADKLSIPIGWAGEHFNLCSPLAWFTKIVGLLITALAASLGAPFWFDVLNNIMSLRGTGKVPDKTIVPAQNAS